MSPAFECLQQALKIRGMTLHDDGEVTIDHGEGEQRGVVSNVRFEGGLLKYDMLAHMDHYLQVDADDMVQGVYLDDAMLVFAPVTPVPLKSG